MADYFSQKYEKRFRCAKTLRNARFTLHPESEGKVNPCKACRYFADNPSMDTFASKN
jgi:hypothetical protein